MTVCFLTFPPDLELNTIGACRVLTRHGLGVLQAKETIDSLIEATSAALEAGIDQPIMLRCELDAPDKRVLGRALYETGIVVIFDDEGIKRPAQDTTQTEVRK